LSFAAGTSATRSGPRNAGAGLGSAILRLTLEKARVMNLGRVLLVCNAQNVASSRIIESNGGQLENQIPIEVGVGEEARHILLSRYWIALEPK
jgi:predicted acetyltransferase